MNLHNAVFLWNEFIRYDRIQLNMILYFSGGDSYAGITRFITIGIED